MSKTEDFPPNRDFLGLLLPRPAEHKARRGGNYLPDSFFQVLCNFSYLPDRFSQVLISLAEAAGELFPKVKYVKVEALGTPIFRGERAGGQPGGERDAPGCRREVPAGRTKEAAGAAKEQAREAKESAGTAKRTAGTAKEQAGESEKERGEDERERGKDERDRQGQRKRPRGQRKSRWAAGIKPIGAPEALIFR